MDIENVGNV